MRRTLRLMVLVVWGVAVLVSSAVEARERQTAGSNQQTAKATLAIVGGTLIDGHGGPPRDEAVVLIAGNKIVAIGNRDSLKPPPGAQVIDAGGMTVMPGLIDGHVHLDILGHTDYVHWHKTYGPRYAEIITTASRLAIMSGVTTVIDMWAPPEPLLAVRQRIDRGEIPGPRIKASLGAILHKSARPSPGRETYSWLVGTPEEARAAAAKMIGLGSDVINMMDGLTREQIEAIAQEARPRGVKLTGIAASADDLMMRVRAGQQALDHMNGLTAGPGATTLEPAVIKALIETRASVIPTATSSGVRQVRMLETPDFYFSNRRMGMWTPSEIWTDIRNSIRHPERTPRYGEGVRYADVDDQTLRLKQLWDSGVRVRIGTDAGAMYVLPTEGMVEEMELMVRSGVPPMEVIVAATRRNAEWLNMLTQLGTITEGKLADIIVVDGNPLVSMRDLRHVVTVVKDGKVLKGSTPDAGTETSRRP